MSRIFDALRKSEKQLQDGVMVAPDTFLETMEKAHSGLEQVAVAQARLRPESRVFMHSDPNSLGAERFRFLRTRLTHWQNTRKGKTLLLTSALPQEGKTLVSLNLATVLAGREGRSVLLLEGDLRRSALARVLGIPPSPGLGEFFEGGGNPLAAIRRIRPLGFFLLPAGRLPGNPVEVLQSQGFAELMRTLVGYFDWILVDSPPAAPLADTAVLKTYTDGILMVVRAGKTSRESVEEALQLLGPEQVVAMVLNGADGLDRSYYSYYRTGSSGGSKTKPAVGTVRNSRG